MNGVELMIAAVVGLVGVRSIVHWLRRPLESDARRDHVLFALFVVSRAGFWFALMGLFLLFATVDTKGRAFIEDAGRFGWYYVVVAVPAALQFVTSFFLGRDARTPPPNGGSEA